MRKIRDLITGHRYDSQFADLERRFSKMVAEVEQKYDSGSDVNTDISADTQQKTAAEDTAGGEKSYIDSTAFFESSSNLDSHYQETKINKEILSMANTVEQGEFKPNDKVELGTVSKAVAEQIYQLTGVNVDGFKMVIEARQMDHILKDHGKQGKTDKSMADCGL